VVKSPALDIHHQLQGINLLMVFLCSSDHKQHGVALHKVTLTVSMHVRMESRKLIHFPITIVLIMIVLKSTTDEHARYSTKVDNNSDWIIGRASKVHGGATGVHTHGMPHYSAFLEKNAI
jgi:hypothetical protein